MFDMFNQKPLQGKPCRGFFSEKVVKNFFEKSIDIVCATQYYNDNSMVCDAQ